MAAFEAIINRFRTGSVSLENAFAPPARSAPLRVILCDEWVGQTMNVTLRNNVSPLIIWLKWRYTDTRKTPFGVEGGDTHLAPLYLSTPCTKILFSNSVFPYFVWCEPRLRVEACPRTRERSVYHFLPIINYLNLSPKTNVHNIPERKLGVQCVSGCVLRFLWC